MYTCFVGNFVAIAVGEGDADLLCLLVVVTVGSLFWLMGMIFVGTSKTTMFVGEGIRLSWGWGRLVLGRGGRVYINIFGLGGLVWEG